MQDNFNVPSAPLSTAEQALRDFGVAFERDAQGNTVVPGNLDLGSKGLGALPDLSGVIVRGDFSCINNGLTSLAGAPQRVGGNYNCSYNNLTDLKGAPQAIGQSFYCYNCDLVTLEGGPKTVAGLFDCHENPLKTLEHAPYIFTRLESDLGTFHPHPPKYGFQP